MMCCTLSTASNIGAWQCAASINSFQRFTILPNITNNLGSSGGKTFFCKIQDGVPLKLKTNVQRPNTRAIPVDWYQFRPNLVFAGQYLWSKHVALLTHKLIFYTSNLFLQLVTNKGSQKKDNNDLPNFVFFSRQSWKFKRGDIHTNLWPIFSSARIGPTTVPGVTIQWLLT
jgi:hypothetical protein